MIFGVLTYRGIAQTYLNSRPNPSIWTRLTAPPPNAVEIRRAAFSGAQHNPEKPRSPEVWFAAVDRYLLCYPVAFNNCGAIDAYDVGPYGNFR